MQLTSFSYSTIPFFDPATHEIITVNESGDVAFSFVSDPDYMQKKIVALTAKLLSQPEEHLEMPVDHTLCDGMYMRKLYIPKGTLLVGEIHLQDCMNIVAKGDISVMTKHGVMRAKAGFAKESYAGTQKVGYAHEDTVFINVFRTEETDIKKIEQSIAKKCDESLALLETMRQELLCQ